MVNIYDDYKNELVEQMAYDLFRDFGIATEKIDPGHLLDVMLMLEDRVKLDVERSEFFTKNGEMNVDFVTSCGPKSADESVEMQDLFERFAEKQNIEVTGIGKHFQKENFDYLLVFFYDEFLDANKYNRYKKPSSQQELIPDNTLLIKSEELANHILQNSDYYFDRIEIKEQKENQLILKDEAVLISVPIKKLKEETNCLFYNGLDMNQEEVLSYLGF